MKEIALIGAGGFAKEVLEIAELNDYKVKDYYASEENSEFKLNYCGYIDELIKNKNKYIGVAIAFGAVSQKHLMKRFELIEKLNMADIKQVTLISPFAVVSKGVSLGDGVFVAHNVTISVDANIGNNVVLNSNAVIGHDTIVENNVMVSPLVFLGGNVKIGTNCLIGATASIMQSVSVGPNSSIGMAASILRNLSENSVVLPTISKKLKAK